MVLLYPFTPVGLFWYGWSVTADTHWIVPIIGTSFIGFGTNGVMVGKQSTEHYSSYDTFR